MVTTVYAARAHFVGGSIHDLLFFADESDAEPYLRCLLPLPPGFVKIEIVSLDIIGTLKCRMARVTRSHNTKQQAAS